MNVTISSMQEHSPGFSVVLFRPHFMLASEEHLMKVHKNQWLLTSCLALKSLGKPCTKVPPWCLGCRRLRGALIRDDPPEKYSYKALRIKHFHGVSSGNQHLYLLKSRYGKVRNKCIWKRDHK